MLISTPNLESPQSKPEPSSLSSLTFFNPEAKSQIQNSLSQILENKVFPKLGLDAPTDFARLMEIVIKMSKGDTLLATSEKFLETKDVVLHKLQNSLASLSDPILLKHIFENNIKALNALVAELSEVKDSNTKILDITREASMSIYNMANSNSTWKVSDKFDFKSFEYYDLETPFSLGDKACDELVESVLNAYGHSSRGISKEGQRDIKLSSWSTTFVPDSVRSLIQFRRITASHNLSGEKVRVLLQTVKLDIAEQIAIEKSDLGKLLKLKSIRMSDTDEIIAACKDLFRNESHKHTDIIKKNGEILKAVCNSLKSVNSLLERLTNYFDDVKRTFELYIGTLFTEEQALIKERKADLNRQQQLIFRTSQAEAYASNPDFLIKKFENNNSGIIRQVIDDIINLCTDTSKNNLLERLFANAYSKTVSSILTHFAEAESDLLLKILKKSPNEVELLDHATAIFTRITAISFKFAENETPEYIKQIFSFSGFPTWIIDWYNYEVIKQQERRKEMPSIQSLRFEFLGYAWAYVQKFELPKALSLDGGQIKRGLIDCK